MVAISGRSVVVVVVRGEVRDSGGGVISRIGVPQYEDAPIGFAGLFGRNITLTGGSAPVRAAIEELLPDVLDGAIEPGTVFDCTVGLDELVNVHRAMGDWTALKVSSALNHMSSSVALEPG